MGSFIDIDDVLSDSEREKNTKIPVELSLKTGFPKAHFSDIIETSLLVVDLLNKKEKNTTVIVFPEKKILGPIFTLAKFFHEIIIEKSKKDYSLNSFKKGDKVSFNNSICKFLEIDGEMVKLEFKGGVISSISINEVTRFQKVKKDKELTRYMSPTNSQSQEKKDHRTVFVEELNNYKTHINNSVICLSKLGKMTDYFSNVSIEDNQVKNILLLSKADYKGNLTNLFDSKLDGVPSIILCTETSSITSLINNQHPISSIVIDSNIKNIEDNLVDFNKLANFNIPVIYLSDFSEYPDLISCLGEDRVNYLIWNSKNLSELIKRNYSLEGTFSNKINNYIKREIEYLSVECNELSKSFFILGRNSNIHTEFNQEISECYSGLYYICFLLSKRITPLGYDFKTKINQKIDALKKTLQSNAQYILKECLEDFYEVMRLLLKIISNDFFNQKIQKIQECIKNNSQSEIYLVLDKKIEVQNAQNYWNSWCKENNLLNNIHVISYSEYVSTEINEGLTILAFLGKESVMRKILYSFNTKKYTVVLYDFEKKWNDTRVKRWNHIFKEHNIHQEPSQSILSTSSQTEHKHFKQTDNIEKEDCSDEYDSLESNLFHSIYSKYDSPKNKEETIDVIPVSFAGGGLSLFPLRHKILLVTNLILESSNSNATQCLTKELSVGDFIAIASRDSKDSSVDLIKQYADKDPEIICARNLAQKWKEAIKISDFFEKNPKKMIDKIVKAGCTKNRQTIRNWLEADCICPQDIEDLKCIAKATGDFVLKEKIEEIFNAGKLVIKAHQEAGRELSEQLQKQINYELKKQNIDPINFWEPIQINISNCDVKIFKIIDIGTIIKAEKKDVNKLVFEW